MHCGFLMTLILLVTGRHRRRLLAALALPILVFYTILTGASPSVVRACIMVLFVLAAPLFQRDSDPPTTLSAALFLILLANPFAAASISLQLSFGAMAGLLWLTPRIQDLLLGEKSRGRVYRLLASSLSATVGAMVFTVPLCAVYFGSLVLISPVSNLLCLTASSAVFMLGLLAVLASFLWLPLGAVIGFLPALLTKYILWTSGVLASLPYHAVYLTNPYLKYWLVFLYGLFAAAYFLRPRARRKYAVATVLAAMSLAVTVWLGAPHYTRSGLDAYVLDVGQGESVLLSSGGQFALVDCGSRNSWYDAGGIAADHLATMGCGTLDYLILTHYDYDHVSGVTELLARTRVGTLLLPDVADDAGMRLQVELAARDHGADIRYVRAETALPLGRSSLTIYPPGDVKGDNEQCLAILCTYGDYDLLVTGDMNMAAERQLIAEYDLPDIEALVVGHHGSKSSTSEELLEAVTPEVGIISVGDNSYGHPTEDALRRLVLADVDICRTDLQGTVHLSVN